MPPVLLYCLALYSLIVTGLAVYGLLFKTAALPPEHPLSTIPDDFGEFPAATRKQVSAARFPVDGELPNEQKSLLGGKIEIGQLVIVPVGIEKRKLTLVRESAEEKRGVPIGEGFVLHLKVTNSSRESSIYPLDPAFDRHAVGADKPATRIVVGSETFAGGPISWPFTKHITREFEQSQETETQELMPGETRDYYVCSVPDPHLVNSVRHAKEPVLWRVQVRRGLIGFRGKTIPVTAIIGVEFRGSDVSGL